MSDVESSRELSSLQDSIESSVRERFGDRFSPADLVYLRQRIARARTILADLDQVTLENGDEPDVVFSVADDESCS